MLSFFQRQITSLIVAYTIIMIAVFELLGVGIVLIGCHDGRGTVIVHEGPDKISPTNLY